MDSFLIDPQAYPILYDIVYGTLAIVSAIIIALSDWVKDGKGDY